MDLAEWLRAFRALHEKARGGALTPDESAAYLAGRDELASALISAQRLLVDASDPPRKALRVALALQVDLESSTSWVRAVTSTVSVGGFSALLAKAPAPGERLNCFIRIPGGERIAGKVVPGAVKPQAENVSASFVFTQLRDSDRERLEFVVFDTALSQFVK